MDKEKLESMGARLQDALNGASAALMLSVGHRVGLFDAMAGMPASTAEAIAKEAGLQERYVREWLGAVSCAGIVEYDSARDLFRLPPEHAALTTRGAGGRNMAATAQLVSVFGAVEDQIVEKFHQGGGVPYSEYGRFGRVMAELSAVSFDATLVDVTLPLVPGVVEELRRGIDVADIATGSGHAVNVMAQAFPDSRFVGFDLSEEGIERARAEAAAMGLQNATFEVCDAAELDAPGHFDFVTTFDAVHDQARPEQVVKAVFEAVKPGGHWLCVDIGASSNLGENLNHPMGTFLYSVSCMHCMTVSLAYDGAGLGAMWGVQQARSMFTAAGFEDVAVHAVPGDPVNNYYVCRRP